MTAVDAIALPLALRQAGRMPRPPKPRAWKVAAVGTNAATPTRYFEALGISLPSPFEASAAVDGETWVATLEIEIIHQQPRCIRLTIDSAAGIATNLLRGLPLESLVKEAVEQTARPGKAGDDQVPWLEISSSRPLAGPAARAVVRRPVRQSDPEARAALRSEAVRRYRDALSGTADQPPARNPRQVVAGEMHLSPASVGRLLWEARQAHELGATPRGVAGEAKPRKKGPKR